MSSEPVKSFNAREARLAISSGASRIPRSLALREVAAKYRRFGYRKLGIILRRDGVFVNHKKLYRIYKADGLAVPRRRKRHVKHERGASLQPVTGVPDTDGASVPELKMVLEKDACER